ncbi:MAG TPA: transcriptional regulator [Ruminococcaceae bacterium]|nr:transcriptional regulator [Oscillospiraceae bacterium]
MGANVTDLFSSLEPQERRVFWVLQKQGPLSKNQLQQITGFKLTTLNRFLRPLEEKSLVIRSQFGKSSGGRKPALYDVNDRTYYILGADISRIYMKVVVTNLKMQVVLSRHFDMEETSTPEWTVKKITEVVKELLLTKVIDAKILLAGVGTVGPMDKPRGMLTSPRYFKAPGWHNVPISMLLESTLGCHVALDNGANTAVLAESLYGIGCGHDRVLYVNCGMGIRMGTFFDGALIHTAENEEDTFGHMVVNADGIRCACGKRGCLDCYASARAIAENFKRHREAGEGSTLPANAPWRDICMAATDDHLAKEMILRAAFYLNVGLSNLIGLLEPGLVILSGPLIQISTLYYQTVVKQANLLNYSHKNKTNFHRGGNFKGDAIAVGAAALALEEAIGVNTAISHV